MIHFLKLNERFYDDVRNGIKTFEIRKDDRGFAVNDKLILREVTREGGYTGRLCACEVRYIIRHQDFPDGIPDGYVVMSIGPVTVWSVEDREMLPELANERGVGHIWFALAAGMEMFKSRYSEYYRITAFCDAVVSPLELGSNLKTVCKSNFKVEINTNDNVSSIKILVERESDVERAIAYLKDSGMEDVNSMTYCTEQTFLAGMFQ
jgi:hypothetical protein